MSGTFERRTATTDWVALEVGRDSPWGRSPKLVAVKIVKTTCSEVTQGMPPVGLSESLHAASVMLHAYVLKDVNSRPWPIATIGGEYRGGCGDDDGQYCLTRGSMMIAPDEFRGLGLGTFMLNEVVRWAKEEIGKPGTITTIRLAAIDARTDAVRDRRNKFYSQFGFTFNWSEPVDGREFVEGRSKPELTVGDLHTVKVPEQKVSVRHMNDALSCSVSRGEDAEMNLRRISDHLQRSESRSDRVVARLKKINAALTGVGVLLLLLVVVLYTAR